MSADGLFPRFAGRSVSPPRQQGNTGTGRPCWRSGLTLLSYKFFVVGGNKFGSPRLFIQ